MKWVRPLEVFFGIAVAVWIMDLFLSPVGGAQAHPPPSASSGLKQSSDRTIEGRIV